MTTEQLLEQYMDERQALGFVGKTDRDCIRRFLQDYENPEDGNVEFTKEYVLGHIGNRLNQKASTVQREASAINGFLDFVIRKGFTAYKVPRRSLPKQIRNFKAYIFSDDEIERMLNAADYIPPQSKTRSATTSFRLCFVSCSTVVCVPLSCESCVLEMWISQRIRLRSGIQNFIKTELCHSPILSPML